jgi:crotonobetaine/carnitine-CoA ligase
MISTTELKNQFENQGSSVVYKLYEWSRLRQEKKFLYYGEENEYLTYAEFNTLTNKIGNALRSLGVNKGDRISLYLFNPLTTVLIMFGIWKVGAVFSPINFNYRGRLLSYQINDTAPKYLITEQSMIPQLNDAQDDISPLKVILRRPSKSEHDFKPALANLELNKKFEHIDYDELLKGDTSNLDTEINYWDQANVIYTSGTTGPAKGVVQSHRWINQYTLNPRLYIHEDDVLYNDLPMYHVAGAFANFAKVVWVGCGIAMWDKFSPKEYWKRIVASGANNAIFLDVMVPWLMNAEKTPKDSYNPLKIVHMQPLPHYHNSVAERFGIDFVTSGYGQTEAGCGFLSLIDELGTREGTPSELYKGYTKDYILETARKCGNPIFSGTDNIKKGLMGRSLALIPTILNEQDEEVEPYQHGQLAFRSKLPYSMLDGYFNKPQANVEVFRNLWFHSGDLCYKDEGDIYYFVDRMGGFIRTRGENISSHQIEDIINSHPSVQVCAALPIPATEGEEDDIVVYVTAEEKKDLNEGELRQWLVKEMPKFMLPKHIRFIDELPRTPTNKIEKYKLKKMILDELKR